jgi:hypothetical protein
MAYSTSAAMWKKAAGWHQKSGAEFERLGFWSICSLSWRARFTKVWNPERSQGPLVALSHRLPMGF